MPKFTGGGASPSLNPNPSPKPQPKPNPAWVRAVRGGIMTGTQAGHPTQPQPSPALHDTNPSRTPNPNQPSPQQPNPTRPFSVDGGGKSRLGSSRGTLPVAAVLFCLFLFCFFSAESGLKVDGLWHTALHLHVCAAELCTAAIPQFSHVNV